MFRDIVAAASEQLEVTWWLVFDASVRHEAIKWENGKSNSLLLTHVIACENGDHNSAHQVNYILDKLEENFEFDHEIGHEWIYICDDVSASCDLAFVKIIRECEALDDLKIIDHIAVKGSRLIYRFAPFSGWRLDPSASLPEQNFKNRFSLYKNK